MVSLGMLWMPILVATILVFVASFLMWMVMPHHRSDWVRMPDEEEVLEALREHGVGPGQYRFPYCASPKDLAESGMVKKLRRGPVGFLILERPGVPNIGRAMGLSLLHNLGVSFVIAYLLAHTLDAGTPDLEVFRVAGTAAILAYAGSLFVNAIWFGRGWGPTLREFADAIVYGLLTAGAFGWLWPR